MIGTAASFLAVEKYTDIEKTTGAYQSARKSPIELARSSEQNSNSWDKSCPKEDMFPDPVRGLAANLLENRKVLSETLAAFKLGGVGDDVAKVCVNKTK